MSNLLRILRGDCREKLKELAPQSIQCCVTSPPYWALRSYLPSDHPEKSHEIGQEQTPQEFVASLVDVFREVRRVLRDDGVVFLNLGDSYAADRGGLYMPAESLSGGVSGHGDADSMRGRGGESERNARRDCSAYGLKHKDLCMVPHRVAIALQADGWYVRDEIVWWKRSCMPSSATDRTTRCHEFLFMLTKEPNYFYDNVAIAEPCSQSMLDQVEEGYDGLPLKDYAAAGVQNPSDVKSRIIANARKKTGGNFSREYANSQPSHGAMALERPAYLTRNKRSVWDVTTASYSDAHFATYPPDLVKPCILAGTSAAGCCQRCLAPWQREIENCGMVRVRENSIFKTGSKPIMKTTGWVAGCSCAAGKPVPCTVLDPFGGSGTTGQVALELGRAAVLVELNEDYIPLIEQRTNTTPGFQL